MRCSGARRIFLYNWPLFVAAWITAIVTISTALVLPRFRWLALPGGVALAWSVASLILSSYIYDRSPLVSGAWLPSLFASPVRAWATIHAGLDSELELDAVLAGRCIGRLDIFDRSVMTSPSIDRARRLTGSTRPSVACKPTALALEADSCDAIVVAFTAHEIRERSAREAFFGELRRVLRPGGRVVLVEHLRDAMSFLAFGPGFLHFTARREWLRLCAHARLSIASETRITPCVMVLTVEKPA